ncbi:MAG: hypothetical protein ACOX2K_10190 [Bacillota bacterium]
MIGKSSAGDTVTLGIHFAEETESIFVTAVIGTLSDDVPERIQFGKPFPAMASAVNQVTERVDSIDSSDGLVEDDSTASLLEDTIPWQWKGVTHAYAGSRRTITIAGLGQQYGDSGEYAAGARSWSYTNNVKLYFEENYDWPWGEAEETVDSVYVNQSILGLDAGRSYGMDYAARPAKPEAGTTYCLVGFPFPHGVSVTFPIGSTIVDDLDYSGDFYKDVRQWTFDGAQNPYVTDAPTDDDFLGSDKGNACFSYVKYNGTPASANINMAVFGELVYGVKILLNSSEFSDFPITEYYSSGNPSRTWSTTINK